MGQGCKQQGRGVRSSKKSKARSFGGPGAARIKKCKKIRKKAKGSVLRFSPMTSSLPGRCLTTGVAIHPLI